MIRSGPVTTKPDGSAVRTLGVMIRVVIVAVALSLGLTALILLHAARTHDKAAAEASCRQVESLLLVTGRHLADHVRDYATWDDAIEKITLARDAGWWDENAGQYALASFDLSLTLAVDGADQVYFLSTPAGTRQAPAGSVLTPSLRAVLARERRRPVPRSAREQATVGLVRIQDDVYLVAASLLLREDNFSPPAHAPEAVLLFALSVRDRVLPELDLAMGGVRVGQAPAPLSGDASLPLTLADGTAAGVLTWAPAAPGRSLIRNVLPLVVLTLLGVAGLTLVFAFRAHRLAGQLVADERERRELAQRYESILDTAGDGIFGVDLQGRILFVNEAAATLLGHPRARLAGADATALILGPPATGASPEGRPGGTIGRALTSGRTEVVNTECFRRADGGCFPVEYVVTPLMQGEQVTGAVVVFRDITRRRESEEDMLYRANFDPVTGLPNRSLLLERLEQELKHARREQGGLAVIFIDLDHFKAVNDALGHRAGDDLLRAVAQRLQGAVREIDSVARLGGDELVVLMPQVLRPEDARALVCRLLGVLHEPFPLGGQAVQIGASMGVALYPEHGDSPAALIDQADLAMYQAKAAGRGGVRFASGEPALAP